MANIFFFHNFVITLVCGCFCASATAASPLLLTRDADADAHNSHMSPRVVELMVIAALIFVSVLLAFYIYRKCKPRPRAPSPMYGIPHSTLIHPTMGTRPIRRASTASTSSSIPLVRASSSSERTVVQEEIGRPAEARTRTRFYGRTAGVFPA